MQVKVKVLDFNVEGLGPPAAVDAWLDTADISYFQVANDRKTRRHEPCLKVTFRNGSVEYILGGPQQLGVNPPEPERVTEDSLGYWLQERLAPWFNKLYNAFGLSCAGWNPSDVIDGAIAKHEEADQRITQLEHAMRLVLADAGLGGFINVATFDLIRTLLAEEKS